MTRGCRSCGRDDVEFRSGGAFGGLRRTCVGCENAERSRRRRGEPRRAAKTDDPVAAAEAREAAARERAARDRLVEEVRELRARQKFLDAGSGKTPSITPRESSPGVREVTPVALASDWHVEETVTPESVAHRNSYDLGVADERIRRFFDAIAWNVEHHRASGLMSIRDMVLWLGGDLYSGYIHEELMESNSLSPAEAVLWLEPRLLDGVKTLLDRLDLAHLEVPCSYGNHGRTTMKPRASTGYANSFDWLLYHHLARAFAGDPRVHFEITASAHQYVEVYGRTLHFHHGDEVKYQGGIGGLGIPLLKAVPAWDRVRAADVHNVGHHHQQRDYGRAVVNGSLIGYGPYSQKIRAEFEEPMQQFYLVDSKRGKCMVTDLWVGERHA